MQFLVLYKTLLALPYSSPAFYTKLETPTIFGHHFFLFIFPFPFSFSISCSFYCLYCLLHFFLFPFYSHKKLVQVQKREKRFAGSRVCGFAGLRVCELREVPGVQGGVGDAGASGRTGGRDCSVDHATPPRRTVNAIFPPVPSERAGQPPPVRRMGTPGSSTTRFPTQPMQGRCAQAGEAGKTCNVATRQGGSCGGEQTSRAIGSANDVEWCGKSVGRAQTDSRGVAGIGHGTGDGGMDNDKVGPFSPREDYRSGAATEYPCHPAREVERKRKRNECVPPDSDVPLHCKGVEASGPRADAAFSEARSTAPPGTARSIPRKHAAALPTRDNRCSSALRPRSSVAEGERDSGAVQGASDGGVTKRRRRQDVLGPLTATHFPGRLPNMTIPGGRQYQPPEAEDLTQEQDAQEDIGPGIEQIYGEEVGVKVGDTWVRPREREDRSGQTDDQLYIAPICTSRLDLAALRELDTQGELEGVLDMITDPKAFEDALLPAAKERLSSNKHTVSRPLLIHLDALVGFGVLKTCNTQPKLTMPAYTVPKKSGGQRFIADARVLNANMRRPPDMRLDNIAEVVTRIGGANWAVLSDARSWFYQFEIHDDIKPYFGIRAGAVRGNFVKTVLQVMCMGWSHSPAIAHRSARVLLPPVEGVTWIDNFVLLASSETEARRKYENFLSRCSRVNATLNYDDPQYGMPRQEFTFIFSLFFFSLFCTWTSFL